MKANELRIGNIVYFGIVKEPIRIIKIDPNSVNIEMAEPIPLTEEWLLNYSESTMNFSFILPNNIRLWIDKSNDSNLVWYFVWKGQHINIKHVHQLQNLYFVLTGEELTLK